MDLISWSTFHTLLQETPSEKREYLSSFLSPEDRDQLEQAPPATRSPFLAPLSPLMRLQRIHYSWFIPFFDSLSEGDKCLVLSAFAPLQRDKLREIFSLSSPLPPLSLIGKTFLQTTLYRWVIGKERELLPIEFLPSHPLSSLLDCTKEQLEMVVALLGLHDLSLEIKQLVEVKHLQRIEKSLSALERKYLKALLKKKEPLFFPKINIEEWDGDHEKIKIVLQQRGLNRLSKAMHGVSSAFLWHISHCFDTGRAALLLKFHSELPDRKALDTLIQQVLHAILFTKSI